MVSDGQGERIVRTYTDGNCATGECYLVATGSGWGEARMSSFSATHGTGFGPIFVIEYHTPASPRWRRWSVTHYPTFSQAQERVDNITVNQRKAGKRVFRIAEYRREPSMTEEYQP